jgi:hypothetical protein
LREWVIERERVMERVRDEKEREEETQKGERNSGKTAI